MFRSTFVPVSESMEETTMSMYGRVEKFVSTGSKKKKKTSKLIALGELQGFHQFCTGEYCIGEYRRRRYIKLRYNIRNIETCTWWYSIYEQKNIVV